MTVGTYFLLDSNNIIIQRIEYDPEGNWKVPDNHSIREAIADVEEGDIWNGSSYDKPIIPEADDEAKKMTHSLEVKIRLAESDWVGLADVRQKLEPDNLVEWDTYRAALREFIITPSPNDPATLEEPEVVWIK